MPQASDDLRDLMGLMFGGERISDGPPTAFLVARGWTLLKDWTWRPPTPEHFVGEKEELCIRFLVDEWDYGGIAEPASSAPAQ